MGRNLTTCLLFILACYVSNAQQGGALLFNKQIVSYSSTKHISETFPFYTNPIVTYKLIYKKNSKTGFHEYYQQYVDSIPVLGSGAKKHYQLNGKLIAQNNNCASPLIASKSNSSFNNDKVYLPTKNGLILTQKSIKKTKDYETNSEQYISLDGKLVYEHSLNRYAKSPDSLTKVHVFFPDPITYSETYYHGNFKDNNDQNNSDLQKAIVLKQIPTLYKNDTFWLENNYLKMVDLGKPSLPIVTSRNGEFFFNRSEPGFENTNVFYHITRFREHMSKLNYQALGDTQILVDAHGTFSDNSFYASNFQPARILFGTGGVDDAEDCVPIIHEYGHFLSDFASPNSNIGAERNALEEGICDYLAASYKTEINDYKWGDIYAWDGQNEFWEGRITNSPKTYPDDFTGTPHSNGEIISGTLMDIYFEIGRDVTDELVFESLYYLDNELTFSQYGDILLKLDEMLFDGNNKQSICNAFKARGIITICQMNLSYNLKVSNDIRFLNAQKFAQNLAPILLFSEQPIEMIVVFDALGSKVKTFNPSSNPIELSPFDFKPGIYIVAIHTKFKTIYPRIIKY